MAVLRPVLPWTNFTPLRNCWLRDPRLSLKGKGLLGYLLSHAPGYKISRAQIVRENDDGKDSVITALSELETTGYLTRTSHRSSGRFAEDDYVITDPFDEHGQRIGGKSAPPERADERETRQSGKPATVPRAMSGKPAKADSPKREIRSIEEEGENTTDPSPLPLPLPTSNGHRRRQEPAGDRFGEFYGLYPKHVERKDAEIAWRAACKTTDPDKIIDVLRRYPFNPDKRYVKSPARWLRARCWEDDLADAAGSRNDPSPHAKERQPWDH